MKKPWERLRVGDRVRLVSMPIEFDSPGYYLHADTRRVYKRLIARKRSIRVNRIDERGRPWIECRFRVNTGRWETHFLLVNHGGWVRVKPRR